MLDCILLIAKIWKQEQTNERIKTVIQTPFELFGLLFSALFFEIVGRLAWKNHVTTLTAKKDFKRTLLHHTKASPASPAYLDQ